MTQDVSYNISGDIILKHTRCRNISY